MRFPHTTSLECTGVPGNKIVFEGDYVDVFTDYEEEFINEALKDI